LRLELARVSADLTDSSRLFHTVEPATEKAQSPNLVLVRGTMKSRPETCKGQGHRPKTKAENAEVNFRTSAIVNPVFQFLVIFSILWKNHNNTIMTTMVDDSETIIYVQV